VWQDIVAMVYSADRLSWYENGASSNKSALFDWSGAEHLIDVRLSGVRDLVLVDLNRDGHYDLAKVQCPTLCGCRVGVVAVSSHGGGMWLALLRAGVVH
jgi:hypothetical protein